MFLDAGTRKCNAEATGNKKIRNKQSLCIGRGTELLFFEAGNAK